MHDPELLILDEPINGLDPIGIAEVRSFIRELCDARGKTILISSHILSEISLLADDIGIIDHGALLEEDVYKRQVVAVLTSIVLVRRVKKQIAEMTDVLVDVKNGNGNRRILSATNELTAPLAYEINEIVVAYGKHLSPDKRAKDAKAKGKKRACQRKTERQKACLLYTSYI